MRIAPHRPNRDRPATAARSSASDRLSGFLQQKGLRHSRQRDVIVEAFFAMGGHVTVEALAKRVRRQDPHIGIATVYRTMKLLAECRLAFLREFGDGHTRYEPASSDHHHDHMICTVCGSIVEFENERIEDLQLRIARSHGFHVESHKLELYGRCSECRHRTADAAR
jgi:Fur family ferric uptake transcriptional regulator